MKKLSVLIAISFLIHALSLQAPVWGESKYIYLASSGLIEKISEKTVIPESVISHTVKKESAWKSDALSVKGAFGLAQITIPALKDVIRSKKEAGKRSVIEIRIAVLEREISGLAGRASDSEVSRRAAYKKFLLAKLRALTLLPDYIFSDSSFWAEQVVLPSDLAKFTGYKSLTRLEYYLFTNPELNLISGMVFMSGYIAEIKYYAETGDLPKDTEPLLAAQLAYNCGMRRFKGRLERIGGWKYIFCRRNGTSLPNETADYGYKFIREMVKSNEGYSPSPDPYDALYISFTALKRSASCKKVLHTLKKYRLYKKAYMFEEGLNNAVKRAGKRSFDRRDYTILKSSLSDLPQWPLVNEIAEYVDNVVKNFAK